MKTKTQQGFAIIEIILILAAVLILAGTGWYVWRTSKNTDKTLDETSQQLRTKSSPPKKPKKTKSSVTQVALSQTYTSSQYGFSFQYPAGWRLKTSLKDLGRGAPEGDIYVEAPDGTKVHFGPNSGGKGGDCWDDRANARTTRTCTTRDIISVDKLTDAGSVPVWLVHASNTAPTRDGGKTTYSVYLSSAFYDSATGNFDLAPTVGSDLGAFLGTYDDVRLDKTALTVFVDGADDRQNSSSVFFNTQEIKEAIPVLESFHA